MKAILMSIKPKWCEKIFSGEKTVEVRKTAPKLEPPFKVYVYRTKEKCGAKIVDDCLNSVYGGGKVVGEFVCDKVEENIPDYHPVYEAFFYSGFEYGNDCLSSKEIQKYGKGDTLYGLHITAPKRYDTPKELSEFYTLGNCEKYDFCNQCKNFHRGQGWLDGSYFDEDSCLDNTRIPVTRAPQSWQYVEEIEE